MQTKNLVEICNSTFFYFFELHFYFLLICHWNRISESECEIQSEMVSESENENKIFQ